jgi:RNA polymerase sigma-70 factor (ECF subfamily)
MLAPLLEHRQTSVNEESVKPVSAPALTLTLSPPEVDESSQGESYLSAEEWQVVEALRRGDEDAFMALVAQYHNAMIRLAVMYVRDRAVAEEVVQDTWLDVLRGIHRFEGRSSLKTWIFRIVTNSAKTRGQREGRTIAVDWQEGSEDEPAVSPDRFLPSDHAQWPHHWHGGGKPAAWGEDIEEQLASEETRAYIQQVIGTLPPGPREVISLRDVEGWSSEEVCNVLAISETNQRVLLHRARSKVRRALEQYFEQ